MKHVVLFSGGLGSWAAAKRVAEKHGTADLILLFCDTLTEDEDLYRFVKEAAENVGGQFVRLCDGRDIWQVFFDNRMMGSSHADMCSRELKREISDKYFADNFTPDNCIRYCGYDWSEEHRYNGIRNRIAPWKVEAPMCEPPYLSKNDVRDWCVREGIKLPRLYPLGFVHNNCGGFCVKAGQSHFRNLLIKLPERYAYHEQKEQEFREYVGKDVSIMRDRRGGETTPLTMKEFRERIQSGESCDLFDWGGCGCFSGD
jgi:hypothetical protein